MRTWLRSLNAQLFLWAILPVMLAITALVTTSVYVHQQEMRDFVSSRDLSLVYGQARMLSHLVESGELDPSGEDLALWVNNLALDMPPLIVIDGEGKALAHPDEGKVGTILTGIPGLQLILSQQAGSTIVSSEGQSYVVSFAWVHDTDWRVIITESVDSVVSPSLRFSRWGPILAVTAVAVSLLIIGFNWMTVVRPIRVLASAADQVTWQSYPEIPFPEGSVHEVDSLHRALDAMVARIREYESSIRLYLGATTAGQEEERARIAREIHDGPVQEIIALGQRLDMIRDSLERHKAEGDCAEEIRLLLNEMRDTQMATVEELRRIVNDLRPVYLEDLGFLPALDMLASQANARGQARVRIKADEEFQRLPLEVELAAYRITQEALNNALQHAEAQNVLIEVACSGNGVLLVISDDGLGFSPPERLENLTQTGQFGLLGIHERVAQLGGTMELNARPRAGTRLTIHLPGNLCAA
jgi:two-component system sensor histidine kinase DegS